PGASLLCGFAAADAGERGGRVDGKGAGAHEHAAHGSAAGQRHRCRRDYCARATGEDSAAGGARCGGGGDVLAAAVAGDAVAWILFSTDAAEQCAADFGGGAAGNFWAGAGGDDVSNATRSRRAGEQYAVWIGGERLERERQRGVARGGT